MKKENKSNLVTLNLIQDLPHTLLRAYRRENVHKKLLPPLEGRGPARVDAGGAYPLSSS